MRSLPGGRWIVVTAVVGGLAAAGAAYASIPDAGGVIHGCYKKVGGALRVVDSSVGMRCNGSETALPWNQVGLRERRAQPGRPGRRGVEVQPDPPARATRTRATGRLTTSEPARPRPSRASRCRLLHALRCGPVRGTSDPPEVECSFVSSATVHGGGRDGYAELGTIALLNDVNVTTDGTTVSLQCKAISGGPSLLGSMIATAVGAITPSS